MNEVTAGRTLVKSPPELWAVCSDAELLAQHLEAFGEIRITRLEPETTVAWEGERASGTVRIEPSGWGTKVTVTAAETESALDSPLARDRDPAIEEPASVVTGASAPAIEPSRAETLRYVPPEPLDTEPEPVDEAARMLPASEPLRRAGFFARLFGRRHAAHPPAVQADSAPAGQEAIVVGPRAASVEPEPVAAQPGAAPVEPAAATAEPAAAAAEMVERPPLDTAAALEAALDSLGQAHRRPFSR